MVDEEQYRRTYRGVIDQPCPYEKAVLTRTWRCSKAARTNIAEREAVNCTDPDARQRCWELLALTRDKANFALGLTHTPGNLPHAKNMKIQCGSLLGLRGAVSGEGNLDDIFELVERACVEYGGINDFPFAAMVRAVNAFKGRRRRKQTKF